MATILLDKIGWRNDLSVQFQFKNAQHAAIAAYRMEGFTVTKQSG